MTFIRPALWIVLLVIAMLLPFLPGEHDPLAMKLSAVATGLSLGGLLLVPTGVVWLFSPRAFTPPKVALAAAGLVVAAMALLSVKTGSPAAGAVILAAGAGPLIRLWRGVTTAQSNRAGFPRMVPIALIVVPLATVAARLALGESAAAWSRERAVTNAAEIIRDIEQFRVRTGGYPVAINSLWADYHPGVIGVDRYRYEPNGESYNLYFEHPSTELGAREIVMYNPRGEQDFSSHATDLLRLSAEEIRRQRGHFASHELPQPGWKRFLFD